MTLKTNYVRGITGMPKLRQTLKYNSDDILYYSEPFKILNSKLFSCQFTVL